MRTIWLILYSIVCGGLLAIFTQTPGLTKYIFSLGALFAGIHFFRKYESLWVRAIFVTLSLVMYFIFVVIYAMYTFTNQ